MCGDCIACSVGANEKFNKNEQMIRFPRRKTGFCSSVPRVPSHPICLFQGRGGGK